MPNAFKIISAILIIAIPAIGARSEDIVSLSISSSNISSGYSVYIPRTRKTKRTRVKNGTNILKLSFVFAASVIFSVARIAVRVKTIAIFGTSFSDPCVVLDGYNHNLITLLYAFLHSFWNR